MSGRTRWKAGVQARKREEAEARQGKYDALTPQQKFDLVVARSFMAGYSSRREIERIINGPGGEKVRT